jgi:hypothetical protein
MRVESDLHPTKKMAVKPTISIDFRNPFIVPPFDKLV